MKPTEARFDRELSGCIPQPPARRTPVMSGAERMSGPATLTRGGGSLWPNLDSEDSILRLLLKDTPPERRRHVDPSRRGSRKERIREARPEPKPPDEDISSSERVQQRLEYLEEGLTRVSSEVSKIRSQENDDIRRQLYQLSEQVWDLRGSGLVFTNPEVRPRKTEGVLPERTRDKLPCREQKATRKQCYRCGSSQHYLRDCPWEVLPRGGVRGSRDD